MVAEGSGDSGGRVGSVGGSGGGLVVCGGDDDDDDDSDCSV